ncbi:MULTISPECIES: Crp/Fnr family transcriptional regulator [Croceivirga]|uniref:Crp/Fnr family transcriptional regulator n=1 Tax=Croceivirga radicis TaxID=1929488 RepID=A0A1V6LV15_9FLAO|nr:MULTISPECIES: Crp/Fnr family transcriptional regulator [Croceivirga]NJB36497.1 Crp/Fnr family transcriptional regulator [Croceivirga sp. JEA036]OQD44021.1 Crp/Fnr family transcriptional regulator [Croceivirga radicis]
MIQELHTSFGNTFEQALLNDIAQVGTFKEVPAGFQLMDIGQYIKYMPLLLEGVIKILREDDEGDELLLYYLEQGDTCSMTMACCLGDAKSNIRAIAETDAKLIMVPIHKMEEWTAKYKTWRNFVFESYHSRLNELLHTVDSIAFMNMDERLIDFLVRKSEVNNSTIITNTHQEIAYDLHSSRVVISRLLKKLENMGKIKLSRSHIEIINL